MKNNVRIERRTLADGTIKEYRYGPRKQSVSSEKIVASVIDAWERSTEWRALAYRTREYYLPHLQRLHAALKLVPISQVKRTHLLTIRDEIAASRGNGAAINFCRTVSALFGWALDRDLIEVSPATRLSTKLQQSQGHLPAWEDAQAQDAMRELPEPCRRAVVLAYHTGQRRGDLCKMRWSDYDGRVIRLTQEKTREPLEIPVWRMPVLQAELEVWKADRQTVTLLEDDGKPWHPVTLSKRLPRRLEQIGLPRTLGLHGLRRLAAINLAEAGCSIHEIAALTGHRTLAMVQEYTRGVRQRDLVETAVVRLAKYKRRKIRQ